MGSFLNYENFTSTLDETLNSESIYDNIYGFSTIGFFIVPPTGGEISFEGSFDGTNYVSISFRGIESNLFINHTDTSQNIVGSIAGLRHIKFKTSVGGSVAGSVTGRVQIQQSILEGIENSTDTLSAAGVNGAITVGTSAVEVKVDSNRLEGRKVVTLHNNSNATFYWGYTNGVTTSNGTPLYKDQFVSWQAGADFQIWVIAGTAGNNARVTEGA